MCPGRRRRRRTPSSSRRILPEPYNFSSKESWNLHESPVGTPATSSRLGEWRIYANLWVRFWNSFPEFFSGPNGETFANRGKAMSGVRAVEGLIYFWVFFFLLFAHFKFQYYKPRVYTLLFYFYLMFAPFTFFQTTFFPRESPSFFFLHRSCFFLLLCPTLTQCIFDGNYSKRGIFMGLWVYLLLCPPEF